MQHEVHTESGTTRLFKSQFLEMLSRTHPAVVPAIWVPVSAILIWYSLARTDVSVVATILLLIGGMFSWTFAEYWLHRLILHWIPNDTWGARMHYWVHGIHHTWPNDPLRLVMPPAVSIILFFIFLGLFRLTLGTYAWAFQAGFTLGYVVYDLTHYVLHHSKNQSRWFKKLQQLHMSHHFSERYETARFGITSPLWDHVFGTYGPSKIKARQTSAAWRSARSRGR